MWIGLVLLALVTSLPEVFTGVSAVTLVDAPDLTIGNIFGANAFNLLNLALLDIAYRNGSLIGAVSSAHRLTGWLSMVLVLVAVFCSIALENRKKSPKLYKTVAGNPILYELMKGFAWILKNNLFIFSLCF